jgi:hypothetical protein
LVRIPVGAQDSKELLYMPIEQFLVMVRFENREKLDELDFEI